jgi:hypothetical protein
VVAATIPQGPEGRYCAYAAEMAGTNLDLESDLQAAAITTF